MPTDVPAPALAFAEGTFVLDQGTLELGIVRDSVLTSTGGLCAPYPLFAESFESVAQIRPVRDVLPRFSAKRGGVDVPAA
jgi:hypothetical protein